MIGCGEGSALERRKVLLDDRVARIAPIYRFSHVRKRTESQRQTRAMRALSHLLKSTMPYTSKVAGDRDETATSSTKRGRLPRMPGTLASPSGASMQLKLTHQTHRRPTRFTTLLSMPTCAIGLPRPHRRSHFYPT